MENSNWYVMRKFTEFANVLRMQHQPEACASDLGDGSHVYLCYVWNFVIFSCHTLLPYRQLQLVALLKEVI